jgi:hypothetical protein
MVDATTAYEEDERPEDALRVVSLHQSTESQSRQLESSARLLDLEMLLAMDEQGGRVDWKRSILNAENGVLTRQEETLVALVNGNPGNEVYLVFGVEDDKSIVGQVSQRGDLLGEESVRACQRRLDQRLQQCRPAVRIGWTEFADSRGRVVVARAIGRRRGTAVMTTYGSYPYRSGEDSHHASPTTVAGWVAEEDPQLRTILEARAEADRGTAELLAKLVEAQEQATLAQRDQLFARLDIVGTALSTAGTGSITIKYVSGKEPAHKLEAWARGSAGVGAGGQEWLAESDKLADVALMPVGPRAVIAGPFHDWDTAGDLSPDERFVGVAWEYSGDKRVQRLVDDWDV